eukprot:358316-Chlamydomonas_euryale.AAC.9
MLCGMGPPVLVLLVRPPPSPAPPTLRPETLARPHFCSVVRLHATYLECGYHGAVNPPSLRAP